MLGYSAALRSGACSSARAGEGAARRVRGSAGQGTKRVLALIGDGSFQMTAQVRCSGLASLT